MSEELASLYRNLNAAARDPNVYLWSIADTPIKRDGSPSTSTPGIVRKQANGRPLSVSHFVLSNPIAMYSDASLAKVIRTDVRTVFCWIVGTPIDTAPDGVRREFSISPLSSKRNGKSEKRYVWRDTRELVDWSRVKAVEVTDSGAFAIS